MYSLAPVVKPSGSVNAISGPLNGAGNTLNLIMVIAFVCAWQAIGQAQESPWVGETVQRAPRVSSTRGRGNDGTGVHAGNLSQAGVRLKRRPELYAAG